MADDRKSELYTELTNAVRDNQTATMKLDHAVVKALGINATDGHCFDILDRHGPMPAGELAKAAGITTGAVTQVVDRLERKGIVERLPDPTDRRRVLLGITEKGRRIARDFYGPLAEAAREEFGYLTEADLELLIGFTRRSTRLQLEAAERILGISPEGESP
jgi:DNA-binding MarR family transcriptional regulator